MKITIFLFLIFSFPVFSQSVLLKGHLVNGKTNEPLSGAKIYIVGGDTAYETMSDGQYRLDIQKGISAKAGDFIEVYIRHKTLGFHKKRIPVMNNYQHDIIIEPDNLVKITGTVKNELNGEPVSNIDVVFISEEDTNNELVVTKSDLYGGYSFLIGKSLVGEQRYALLKFYDKKDNYHFHHQPVHIKSPAEIKLKPKKTDINSYTKPKTNFTEPDAARGQDKEKPEPVKLVPVKDGKYGTVDFNSGRGVKRFEFKYSPVNNEPGYPIADGDQVKILRKKKSDRTDWYEIEYKGEIGWIKAKYINLQ